MFLCFALLALRYASASPPPPFGFAARALTVSNAEVSVATFNVSQPGTTRGVIRTIFIESGELLWPSYDALRLRVYVDSDAPSAPSIDAPLGFFDEGDMSPWGAARLGNTGFAGAAYLRIPIPFYAAARVALVQGQADSGTHTVRVAVTGAEEALLAPPGPRQRALTFALDAVAAPPGAPLALFDSAPLRARLPFATVAPTLVGLTVSGGNTSFYAGAVRVCVGGGSGASCAPLSYGLESFFLAETGLGYAKYVTPVAGVTAKAILGQRIIAWRELDEWAGQESVEILWDVPADAGFVAVSAVVWAVAVL